ncbi:hypothetical protein KGF54_005229 [Candida jiufengensis]|uniref:uncharacterized protein n=1 Tax=Candida jiufengensis TaxID=497108 RepID=UPI0022246EBF|nr:uncharacterized protein KGF54_005229 [Candida jiufengensis]KAI5950272.1 hypothetical protein KGF54_005229 [Candida jiufengensis]
MIKLNPRQQKIKSIRLIILSLLIINIVYIFTYGLNFDLKSIHHIIQNSSFRNKNLSIEDQELRTFLSYIKLKFNLATSPNVINEIKNNVIINQNNLNSSLIIYKNHTEYWNSAQTIFYDPRFTLTMYLHELKLQYQQRQINSLDQPQQHPITLPFNWVDWMDLTLLNKDILETDPAKKISCDTIVKNSENQPEGFKFCLNKEQISEEKLQDLGYRKDQLPNFLIWAHQAHTKRIYNDFRILQSKSFAMINMKPPLKVVILNDIETFEFEVEGIDRINKTPMLQNYLKLNKPQSDRIEINYLTEFQNLKDSVSPTIENQSQSKNYKITLNESMFQVITIDQHLTNLPEPYMFTPQQQLTYNGLIKCSESSAKDEKRFFKMATLRIDDDKNLDNDWGWHYDWRFFNGALNYENGLTKQEKNLRISIILERLLRNWSKFALEKNIIWWIMHGPLLSWYWNGMMFPFDVDVDIQMPVSELYKLNELYNQTLVVENPTEGFGKFLIETNTYIYNRDFSGGDNYIDARFIDIDSGIYIDITGISKSSSLPTKEYGEHPEIGIQKFSAEDEIYNDRRKHFYKLDQLSPLKFTYLQSIPVFIPNEIKQRLTFEYPKGLTSYEYSDWYFVKFLQLWIHKDNLNLNFENYKKLKKDSTNDYEWDKNKIIEDLEQISNEKILELLKNKEILYEFFKTFNYTNLHEKEMIYFDEDLDDDDENLIRYEELVDMFKTFNPPLRSSLWEFENDLKNKKIKSY